MNKLTKTLGIAGLVAALYTGCGKNTDVLNSKEVINHDEYTKISKTIKEYLLNHSGKDSIEIIGKDEDPNFYGFDAFTRDFYEKVTNNKKMTISDHKIWKRVLSDIAAENGIDGTNFIKKQSEAKYIII